MALTLGKAADLVLDRRAISGSDALDLAGIHGRSVDIVSYDAVGLFVGIGKVAVSDIALQLIGHKGEGRDLLIPLLHLHFRVVDVLGQDSCGSSRLKTAKLHASFFQIFAQNIGGSKAGRPALIGTVSDKDLAPKKGSRRKDHCPASIVCSGS